MSLSQPKTYTSKATTESDKCFTTNQSLVSRRSSKVIKTPQNSSSLLESSRNSRNFQTLLKPLRIYPNLLDTLRKSSKILKTPRDFSKHFETPPKSPELLKTSRNSHKLPGKISQTPSNSPQWEFCAPAALLRAWLAAAGAAVAGRRHW